MGKNLSQKRSKEDLLAENNRLRAALKERDVATAVEDESLFSSLIEDAMFPIVIVSTATDSILYTNHCATGYFRLDSSVKEHQFAKTFWKNKEERKEYLDLLHRHGEVREFHAELITAADETRHVILASRRIRYKEKDAVYSIFRDITERVRVKKAYEESEARYEKMYRMVELMANTLPDLIWAKDLDDQYIFANTAIREKLLICDSTENLIGKNDLFFARRERELGHEHTFGEICLNSDDIVKRIKKKKRFLEDGLVRGRYLALDVHKAPLFDKDGSLIGTVGAGRDVTADIATQKALEESERRFRLLASSIRDVLWIADMELQPTYVTPSIEAFSGYTPEEFVRLPFISHMTERYQRRFTGLFRKMNRAIEKGDELFSDFMEFECKKKNGTIIWVEIAASPIWDKRGHLIGFTGMIRDSTKRVQQQLELKNAKEIAIAASRTKSEFLANMSHEIRTPMNGVLGLLQLLQETELNPMQEKYVGTALQAGKSLLKIISDILDFSKIEAGKIECVKAPVDLRQLVSSVVDSFETVLASDTVALTSTIDTAIPDTLLACESRLEQVLVNLIGNAVKFTQKGSVDLDVSIVPREDSNQLLLQFTVTDTGIGISKNMLDHLFEPFSQEDGSYRRKYGGTGLGLSIVKNLVGMMGGKIWLTSKKGEGTRVSFTLLADTVEDTVEIEEAPVQSEQAVAESGRGEGKILVVEDEQINAMVISAMLKSFGFSVEHVSNGLKALEILKDTLFDCVFMDIQMPEMDGIETTREIRHSLNCINVGVPIVALTAHAMKGDREQFISAGMNDYLSKPVEVDRLTEVLERLSLKKTGQ